MRRLRFRPFLGLALAAVPLTAWAQHSPLSCDDRDHDRSGERVCEIRETTLSARDLVAVNAAPNGGIRVRAWNGNGIRLRARVEARARTSDRAEELVSEVEIDTEGTIQADGPRTGRRESWHVTFELFVPRETDLDLRSTNGGIAVDGVQSRMELETVNGGLALMGAGGNVYGRTTNGGIDVELTGTGWEGEGLDLRTTNGGVAMSIPEGYGARLETATVNGGMESDFPVTVRGRIGRELNLDLGSGGKTLRVRTTNGGVSLRRS